jgi:hypothetical protein
MAMAAKSDDHELSRQWDKRKAQLIERSLGKEFNLVMHAIIPFAVGGALDLYYYPNGAAGTGIATRELSEVPGKGASNDVFGNYELVMFTRHAIDLKSVKDGKTPFAVAHRNISSILNPIARYSFQAKLNPNETCEFPADMPRVGGKCMIFDSYALYEGEQCGTFGLLAVIEVFRSEMDFARKHRGAALLSRLKNKGFYPYSDMDREAVA